MTRFVISLTTLPDRLPYIKPVLDSILDENPDIDKLYICLPHGDVDLSFLPKESDKVKIIRCRDYGPITKILGCLEYENNPETRILTLDDDTIVIKNLVKTYLNKSRRYPDSVISMSGWCYGTFPNYFQLATDNKNDVHVDWVQGVHGILYKRKFLNKKEILDFDKDVKALFKNDDHRISAYLETKGIDRISIGVNPKDFFKEYTPCSKRGSISGDNFSKAVVFWKDVYNISTRYKKKGIYYHHYSNKRSIVTIVLVVLIILLTLFVLFYYIGPSSWIYLIIVFFLLIVLFRIIMNKSWSSLLIDKFE